jgi:hypothetical protein
MSRDAALPGGDSPYGGTVAETAQLITEAGGKGIAVAVDHADDQAVAALFHRIKQEHGSSIFWSTMRRT